MLFANFFFFLQILTCFCLCVAFLRPPLNTVAHESSVLQGKLLNARLLKKNICILKVIIAIAKVTFEEFMYHYQLEVSSTHFKLYFYYFS